MYRQQQVVRALQRQVRCNLLGSLPAVLDAARRSIWTSLPLEDVPDMLNIHVGPLESHVLFDAYNVTLTPDDVARVHAAVAHAFDDPAPTAAPGSSHSPAGC